MLDSNQVIMQVHESVGHPLELDRVLGMEEAYAGTSFVRPEDRGTLRYGSPLVTIVADASLVGGLGTFGFDDEGVPAARVPLIEDGVFQRFISSRETAPVIGERSNGSMRADGWQNLPLIRMTNINLEPGDAGSLDDIIGDTEDGIFMTTNSSWSIDDKRVNFQFGCEAAWRIQQRQADRAVQEPELHGDHHRAVGVVRRGRGPRSLAPVGHAELRQGPARPDRPGRPRRPAGPVPERAGRGAGMTRPSRRR